MGYRSVVNSMVYGTEEALTTYMAKEKLEHTDNSIFTQFKGHLKLMTIQFPKGKTHALSLELEHVKWYDEYSDVQAWDRFMKGSTEHDLSYEFIRIGEDHNDIEREDGGDVVEGLLYTICTIEKDYPQPTKEEIL